MKRYLCKIASQALFDAMHRRGKTPSWANVVIQATDKDSALKIASQYNGRTHKVLSCKEDTTVYEKETIEVEITERELNFSEAIKYILPEFDMPIESLQLHKVLRIDSTIFIYPYQRADEQYLACIDDCIDPIYTASLLGTYGYTKLQPVPLLGENKDIRNLFVWDKHIVSSLEQDETSKQQKLYGYSCCVFKVLS